MRDGIFVVDFLLLFASGSYSASTDLFWLLFVMSTLQPALRHWLLQTSRARLIARSERELRSRVILLVHRQETMSLLGFPLTRYIDVNDAEEVLRACELTDPEMCCG